MITVDFTYLDPPNPCRILDIGCGNGRHLGTAYGLDGALSIGADPDVADLLRVRERLRFHQQVGAQGRGSQCHLTAAVLDRLPFKDHSFNVVICSEVLEHVADMPAAIGELARVLAPHGKLVVSMPRCWPETLCWLLSRPYRSMPGGHIRIIKTEPLKARFRRTGLRHRHTHWAHSLHVPYWWLKCLVGIDRNDVAPVRLYHRLLVWDMMARPGVTRILERLLNPLMGKSVVLYFSR